MKNNNEKTAIEYINKYKDLVRKNDLKILDVSDKEYFSLDDNKVNCERINICDFVSNYKLPRDFKYDFILYFNREGANKNNNLKLLKVLSKSCKILLTNLALINDYNDYSKFFSYWNEIEFYFEYYKGETPTYRPFVFASNEYCLSKTKNNIDIIHINENKNMYFNNDSYYINEKSIYDRHVDNNIIFRKEMLIYAPFFIACNFIKNNFNLDLNNYIIADKDVKKILLKKNEIGSMYRIYFNKILKTSFYLDKNCKVYSKTKFINTLKKEVTNGKIIIVSGIKRYLSNGKTIADIINENIADKKFVKKQFENFLLEVFNKYKTEHDDLLLSTCLNSATLQNCIFIDNKYIFFDEKHKLKDKYVEKSFVVFSSIYNSIINDINIKNELYIYLCIKFNLKYKPKEFLEYQKYLWSYDKTCKYNIDSMHLVDTIKKLDLHM